MQGAPPPLPPPPLPPPPLPPPPSYLANPNPSPSRDPGPNPGTSAATAYRRVGALIDECDRAGVSCVVGLNPHLENPDPNANPNPNPNLSLSPNPSPNPSPIQVALNPDADLAHNGMAPALYPYPTLTAWSPHSTLPHP